MSFSVVTENQAVAAHDDEFAVASPAHDDYHVYQDVFASAARDDYHVDQEEFAVAKAAHHDYHVDEDGFAVASGAHDDYHVDEDGFEALLNKIPSAFRFSPTDEQLMVYYLGNKVSGQPLPPNLMEEIINFYDYGPETLTEIFKGYRKMKGDWYFFTPIYQNARQRACRYAGDGYWLDTGMPVLVHSKKDGEELGWKKTFHYYKGTLGHGLRTNFVMHEYTCFKKFMTLEHWVLCSIHLLKKAAPKYLRRSMSNLSLASTTEVSSSDSEDLAMEED